MYRPDIDGLRAVAVLGVILFHAGNPLVAGGYVGVDVFFVISGYLITGILKRELADNTFSFARFFERRARRILPALLVVLGTTLAACAILMFADDARVVGRSAVAVLLFAANFLFWRGAEPKTDDYFNPQLHEQPLLHTWSLGVEEQYYLLFPAALLAIWRLRRQFAGPALVVIGAVSFALCVWWTTRDAAAAFYLLPTRVWQLMAGGVLAWFVTRLEPPTRQVHELIALSGLALVVLPMAQFNDWTQYPGWRAALPVLGAVVLILYAPGSGVGRALASRPIVFVGLISYSAYLWHQPVFAVARYTSLSSDLGPWRASALCAVTLLLAAASWRWIETPFRDRLRIGTALFVKVTAAALVAVGGVAGWMAFGDEAPRRAPIATNAVAQAALSLFTDCNSSRQLTGFLGDGCLLDPSSAAPPTFLVVGDSHADALYPAFARASRETGRQGRLLQHMSCSPMLEHSSGSVPVTPSCRALVSRALAMVEDRRIDSVFLVSRLDLEYVPDDQLTSALDTTIAAYGRFGAKVYIVTQAPVQPHFNKRTYLRAVLRHRMLGDDTSAVVAAQSVTLAEHRRARAFVDSVLTSFKNDPRVELVDIEPLLCGKERCAAGSVSGPYYSDSNHLNTEGALRVSAAIAARFASPPPSVPSR